MHPGPGDFNIWRKIVIEPWQQWFAWYPVKLNGKRVWLKSIYRRCRWHYGGDNGEYAVWEYGTLFDVLTKSQ